MKKILNIIASINGETSFSTKLSNAIIDQLTSAYPDSIVKTHDLANTPFPHLEARHFEAFYTPAEMRSEAQKEAVRDSDEAIKELMDADIIVIGVPLYDFGIPSTMKAWIDHIVRRDVTFNFIDNHPVGFITGKKIYLAIASGGVYTEGAMQSYDFTEPYLRLILGFIGLTDVTTFRIEGTVMPEIKETALAKAVNQVNEYSF